jgi:hypothetical protein
MHIYYSRKRWSSRSATCWCSTLEFNDFEAALPSTHLVNGVMMRRNDIDI